MSLKKFWVIPLIIGVLACLIQAVDQLLMPYVAPVGNKGFSWIAFQSWATYFLAGCTLRGGVKTFLAYALGIGGSILIMLLGGSMANIGFWAVPLAVGAVAFCVIFLERIEILSLVPALFIGAGAFFAFMNYVPGATFGNAFVTEMIYCTLGLVFGWVTVALRTRYTACATKEK